MVIAKKKKSNYYIIEEEKNERIAFLCYYWQWLLFKQPVLFFVCAFVSIHFFLNTNRISKRNAKPNICTLLITNRKTNGNRVALNPSNSFGLFNLSFVVLANRYNNNKNREKKTKFYNLRLIYRHKKWKFSLSLSLNLNVN